MAKEFAKKFYDSAVWKMTRRIVLHRDHYTCADCYGRAQEVHHVIELTPQNINNEMVALNPDNLISLCGKCHKKRTKGNTGDISEGYVFDEGGQVVKT
jgi:5-methylcytosine-specific restriction endonuclease McrA